MATNSKVHRVQKLRPKPESIKASLHGGEEVVTSDHQTATRQIHTPTETYTHPGATSLQTRPAGCCCANIQTPDGGAAPLRKADDTGLYTAVPGR